MLENAPFGRDRPGSFVPDGFRRFSGRPTSVLRRGKNSNVVVVPREFMRPYGRKRRRTDGRRRLRGHLRTFAEFGVTSSGKLVLTKKFYASSLLESDVLRDEGTTEF